MIYMGTYGIFHFYANWWKNACDTQIASQMHFSQMYIKRAQCWYSLEGN